MRITVCDICRKEKPIYFKCKIKKHWPAFEIGQVFDDPTWFAAEICEDCLNLIKGKVQGGEPL